MIGTGSAVRGPYIPVMRNRITLPRQARRAPAPPIHEEERERVLAETETLKERARRGERPEEIIDKGRALSRIKELRPWRFAGALQDGKKRGFKQWVKENLPYGVARANEYVRIALHIKRELVLGRR